MQTIDYLELLINDQTEADQKFMLVEMDDLLFKITLYGKPQSVQDPNINFDSVQIPFDDITSTVMKYQVDKIYCIKNGIILGNN